MTEKLLTRVAVFIMLENSKGQILLQQRSNTGYCDGCYDFACSGHVEANESLQETAIRELIEELGIIAKATDLKLIHINQSYVDRPYINLTFHLKKWQGNPVIKEANKCSDLRWFDKTILPDQRTLNVRLNEVNKFSPELTYSKTSPQDFEKLMGFKLK